MKRKINKKNIPGYAYGASEVTSAVTNGLASTIPYATSGLATVGTALGGMASGAAAGAALGPWGAVAGAAIGGIMGSIGSGGSVDEQTGEITNPSGIAGLFGHSKSYLKRKSNRIVNSNLGRQMTDMLRADYYNNSTAEYNPNTFAEGGIVPTTLGWVDDGEFGRNTDGTLFKVPDEGKPTDSNLMQLEVGSLLWSPNLKNPNTKNTFAVDAENIAKKYKTSGTGKYAENTKKLNNILMHKELDDLLAVQEGVKMKKNKIKNNLPAYEGGKNGREELAAEIAARKMANRSMDDYFLYRKDDGSFVMQDIDGNQYAVPDTFLPYIQGDESGYWFGPQTGVAPSAGKWNGSTNFAKQILNSKNISKLRNTATRVLPKNAKPAKPVEVNPVSPNAKPVDANVKDLGEAMESARMAYGLNRAMMSQAWLRGRTSPNNLAGTTAGRDVGSQALWNLPKPASAVDDMLVGEGFKSNWPYYVGLAGMVGAAGTFLSSEYAKNNPTDPSTGNIVTPTPATAVKSASEQSESEEPQTAQGKNAVVKPVTTKKSKGQTSAKRVTVDAPPEKIKSKISPNKSVKVNNVEDIPASKLTPLTKQQLDEQSARGAQIAKGITNPVAPGYRSGWDKFADTLPQIAQLAAPILNIAESKKDVERVDPVYMTPTFGRTTVDPRRAINEIAANRAITNYNAPNLGGAGMAYSLQNALNTNRSISDLYSDVYDKEIALSHSNAGIANNAAIYNANAKRAADEAYAQNKAAAHNLRTTGISQLGQAFGQMGRDRQGNKINSALAYALAPQLRKGMLDADVDRLYSILGYGY